MTVEPLVPGQRVLPCKCTIALMAAEGLLAGVPTHMPLKRFSQSRPIRSSQYYATCPKVLALAEGLPAILALHHFKDSV